MTMFHDREHAARELVERLAAYRGRHALVLAIPRGAVPMGRIIADALEGELDVVLVHKLGAPGNPEFAIGAVDETGEVFLSRDAQVMGIDQRYIEREAQSQLAVLRERRERYTPVRPPIDPKDRTVIVVDDGVATGATFTAALRAVRSKGPEWLCAAAAVIAPSSAARLRGEADELVYVDAPEPFFAVGQFFQNFSQVTDEDVVRILQEAERPSDG